MNTLCALPFVGDYNPDVIAHKVRWLSMTAAAVLEQPVIAVRISATSEIASADWLTGGDAIPWFANPYKTPRAHLSPFATPANA